MQLGLGWRVARVNKLSQTFAEILAKYSIESETCDVLWMRRMNRLAKELWKGSSWNTLMSYHPLTAWSSQDPDSEKPGKPRKGRRGDQGLISSLSE